MKVLHISTSDRGGGAAIAAFRLTEAMRKEGIDAMMLVCEKKSDSNFVVPISKSLGKFSKYFLPIIPVIFNAIRGRLMHNTQFAFINGISHISQIVKHPLINMADVIYIHWVQGCFMNIKDIEDVAKTNKPVFLVLHDMWYITGGCHHSFTCDRWKSDCKQCPAIERHSMKDFPSKTLKKKRRRWDLENIKVITPSEWLSEKVRLSPIFRRRHVYTIPNTINSATFSVIDKKVARGLLGLPLDKNLILFGAVAGSANPYKGWNYMKTVMEDIRNSDLVVFGNSEGGDSHYSILGVGRITDEQTLALLYNAVDVYVSPTIAESFGQTIVEALSCGTRVAAFGAGAVPEIMNEDYYGCLVKVGDCKALAGGINKILVEGTNSEIRQILHDDMRKKYSYDSVMKIHKSIIVESNT